MKLEDLKESKIITHNKEHCKAVLDRLYELIDARFSSAFIERNGKMCGMIYIHNHNRIGWDRENYDYYPDYKTITLGDLYSVKKERKKIAFYEHVNDCGCIRFMTEEKKAISIFSRGNNLVDCKEKSYKIPNGRVIYAYVDNLEYCDMEE